MKIVQVCKEENCNNNPIEIEVGNMKHTFCCQKGFEESTRRFTEYMKENGSTFREN